jgi:hypothetical protein
VFSSSFGSDIGIEGGFVRSLNLKHLRVIHSVDANKTVNKMNSAQMLNKIEYEQTRRPVLVVTKTLPGDLSNVIVPTFDMDLLILSSLDEQIKDGKHVIVHIQDEVWLRGINYRAPHNGITFFLAWSFSSDREY